MRFKTATLSAGAVALVGLAAAGCGVGINDPNAFTEQCLGENPPPGCPDNNPPVENVVPRDQGVVVGVDVGPADPRVEGR